MKSKIKYCQCLNCGRMITEKYVMEILLRKNETTEIYECGCAYCMRQADPNKWKIELVFYTENVRN